MLPAILVSPLPLQLGKDSFCSSFCRLMMWRRVVVEVASRQFEAVVTKTDPG